MSATTQSHQNPLHSDRDFSSPMQDMVDGVDGGSHDSRYNSVEDQARYAYAKYDHLKWVLMIECCLNIHNDSMPELVIVSSVKVNSHKTTLQVKSCRGCGSRYPAMTSNVMGGLFLVDAFGNCKIWGYGIEVTWWLGSSTVIESEHFNLSILVAYILFKFVLHSSPLGGHHFKISLDATDILGHAWCLTISTVIQKTTLTQWGHSIVTFPYI